MMMMMPVPRLALRLGFWAASLCAAAFLVFTVCFGLLLVSQPLFLWQDLASYLAFVAANDQILQHTARLCALLFALSYLVLLHAIAACASPTNKIVANIGLSFGLGFVLLVGLNYFVQLTAVRVNIAHGSVVGLEQIVQANPYSAVAAVNMLGWSLFLGLSSLFVAPLFAGSRLARWIRWLFVANGCFCLLAALAYGLESVVLLFLTINLGMGGAVTLLSLLLALSFRRALRAA